MATLNEKRGERGRLLDELSAMLDRATAAKRELNATERSKWSEASVKIDNLASEIGGFSSFRTGADLATLQAEASKPQPRIAPPWSCLPGSRDGFGDSGGIKFLRNDERLADLDTYSGLPDGIRPDELSLGRMVRGIALGSWHGAEAERRTLSGSNDVLGGYLLPSPTSATVIDMARARSVCMAAGALTIPMETSSLVLAKVSQDPTAYWRPEGTAITESDLNFAATTLYAKTLGAVVKLNIELIEDAANVVGVVETAIASALALKLDYAALMGSGAGEPGGIYFADGVNVVSLGTDGGSLSGFDKFSEACQAVVTANGIPGAVVYGPRTAGSVDRFKDGEGHPLTPPASFAALKRLVSTQVPITLTHGMASTATAAFLGDFAALGFGIRTQVVLEASRTGDADAFKNLQVLIRAYLRADTVILRPTWLTRITGILN
jgi:HK97 family phage major capsid protein